MKRHLTKIVIVILLFWSRIMFASVADNSISVPASIEAVKVTALIERLDEIHEMDRTSMSRLERRAFRKEVKAIAHELKDQDGSGGTYIFLGGMILVIILLNVFL